MRKALIFLLIFSLLMAMAGCGRNQPLESTASPTNYLPTVSDGPLIDYDPNREIYVLCENIYGTIFSESSWTAGFHFYIISKYPITDFSVEIDTQITYDVMFSEVTGLGQTPMKSGKISKASYDASVIPFYVYLNYHCTDFSGDFSQIEEDAYQKFLKLQPDDLPTFYAYTGFISFSRDYTKDETITAIDFIINGEIHEKQIGAFHLIVGQYDVPHEESKEIETEFRGFITRTQDFYSNGLGEATLYNFEAPQDMELAQITILDQMVQPLNYRVTVTSSSGSKRIISWDGKSTIPVTKGSTVEIYAIFNHPALGQLFHCVNFVFCLDVVLDGITKYVPVETQFYPMNSSWYEYYAMIFDGVDMCSYYTDYYYPTVHPWRAEYTS